MAPLETAILAAYFCTLLLLSVYGLHRYALVYLYYRHRAARGRERPLPAELPLVTVQLPVYNERYVVARLIESVARIRYPRERLEIQVLDDSDDDTSEIVARLVERHRASGVAIRHLRRPGREGFKAGALAHGLACARGELLLILDADFIAPPDLLERTLGHFDDPRVGMVQARWGHVNRGYSLLTEVQAILLDAHFVLEHGGRHRSGRFFNFNGTAGIWRRAAIQDAGGWQHDTLTEDLDLSYRAQLRGWRFVFLPGVVCEAELPVEMDAFKSQQRRWAKGSAQTCRKLLASVLRSPQPLAVKLEAAVHLTSNLAYPLMVLLSLLIFPALVIRSELGLRTLLLLDLPLLFGATLSVSSFYLASQREVWGDAWRSRLLLLPAVLATGIGISLSNAKGVLEGLLGLRSGFERTPKYRVERKGGEWLGKRYRSPAGAFAAVELLMGANFVAAALYAATNRILALPFVLLFAAGFLHTGLRSVSQALRRRLAGRLG